MLIGDCSLENLKITKIDFWTISTGYHPLNTFSLDSRLYAMKDSGTANTHNITKTHTKLTQNLQTFYWGFPLIRGGFKGVGQKKARDSELALLARDSLAQPYCV